VEPIFIKRGLEGGVADHWLRSATRREAKATLKELQTVNIS
jgi:hypothetical protein